MIKLKVNGAARLFEGDPEMPLLWYTKSNLLTTQAMVKSLKLVETTPILLGAKSK